MPSFTLQPFHFHLLLHYLGLSEKEWNWYAVEQRKHAAHLMYLFKIHSKTLFEQIDKYIESNQLQIIFDSITFTSIMSSISNREKFDTAKLLYQLQKSKQQYSQKVQQLTSENEQLQEWITKLIQENNVLSKKLNQSNSVIINLSN